MTKSPEYPDLPWVTPKSWSSGRASGQPTVIVIHTTEGSEHGTSAEDGAAYDTRRTDGTSTHYFHDANSTIQCVKTTDRSHTARATGNKIGIHHELCGRAGQGSAGWADENSQGTLRQAAKQCARDAAKWKIPVRKLTAAQVKAGEKGFCGHVDISYAFGESTHTDPGKDFPWDKFIELVKGYQDMSFETDQVKVSYPKADTYTGPTALALAHDYARRTYDTVVAQGKVNAALLKQILDKDTFDEAKFAAELAPKLAAAVIAGLPEDRDDVTVEELTAAIRNIVAGTPTP